MNFSSQIVDVISDISPVLGTALGGPAGGLVGSLISKILGGVDMDNPGQVIRQIQNDPSSTDKLKELEDQISDLQNARLEASKETGFGRIVRPLLALFAMIAIFADILLIDHVSNDIVKQILIVMLVCLVWDVRQIYRFYFGNGELPNFMGKINKRF